MGAASTAAAPEERRPPNLRLFACVVAALVLGAGGYYLNLGQMYYMAGMTAAVPLVAYLFSRVPLRSLKIRRSAPERLHEGDEFEVSLQITNPGRAPRTGLWIEDTLSRWTQPETPAAFAVPMLWARRPVDLAYRVVAAKRGEHTVGPLLIAARDPLGFFEQRRRAGQAASVLVYPQILRIAAGETSGARAYTGTESGRASIAGEGLEFYGVRDYQAGDELRRIDWKATARLGNLVVTEFDQSMSGDLVVALDLVQGSDVGEGRESTLEYGARIAASLANYALQRGAAFTLLASSDGRPDPVHARRLADLDRVLEALARAKAAAPEPLSALLGRTDLRVPADGTLVLITARPDAGLVELARDWLARRLRVVALVLDPSSFAQDDSVPSPDLEGVLTALAALGVAGHVVRRGEDLATALNQAIAGVLAPDWRSGAAQ